MTNSELIYQIRSACTELYDQREAMAITYLVADKGFGVSRTDVALYPDAPVRNVAQLERVCSELSCGTPVQYVLGVADFYGREFEVGKGVLIPRPETEELVDWIVRDCGQGNEPVILDVGTGSGIIAVSLALEIERSKVYAIDLETMALEWAQRNIDSLNVDVRLFRQDALLPYGDWSNELTSVEFDIIVSNPPYIPQSDLTSMHRNVAGYEPHSALFVDDSDPLVFYRAIAESGQKLLGKNGMIYFEIYEQLANELEQMLYGYGYTDIVIREDLNAKPRMCRCRKG